MFHGFRHLHRRRLLPFRVLRAETLTAEGREDQATDEEMGGEVEIGRRRSGLEAVCHRLPDATYQWVYSLLPCEDAEWGGLRSADRSVVFLAEMLALEPMLLLLTIYVSFVYGFLYLLLGAIPIE
jgi:hypothetical protein